jgi:hypothetical protein
MACLERLLGRQELETLDRDFQANIWDRQG